MAKFTAGVPLNIKWNGLEISGAAGATHRIPDAYYEEFNGQFASLPGLTWISQDEATSIVASDINVTALTATGAVFNGDPWFDVTAFGAVGDGVADDTSAINAAIAAGAGQGIVFFPRGMYKITSTLGPAVNYSRLRGAGAGASIITQYGSNAPILRWGGYNSTIEDLGFQFNTPQTSAQTGGVGIELYAPSWCSIDRVRIIDTAYGMKIKQATTTLGGGAGVANYVASCSFRDILVEGFAITGIELTAFGGGSSGCHFANIHIQNRDATALVGLDLGSMSDSVFDQLNVESAKLNIAIQVATGRDIVFNSIHLEQVVANSDFNGFLYFNGGGYVVNGLLLYGCQVLVGNVATRYAIIRVNNDTRVMLRGLDESNTTRTTANFDEWMFSGTTSVEVHVEGAKTAGTTSVYGGLSDLSVLRSRNATLRPAALTLPGGTVSISTGTAFPSSPATNDVCLRTDRDIEYYYDGMRWLSTTLYSDPLPQSGEATVPYSATNVGARMAAAFAAVYDLWLVEAQLTFFVSGGTALDASNKWVGDLKRSLTGTTLATFNIDSGASGAWRTSTVAIGALLGTSEVCVELTNTKTGTPGNLYALPRLNYRLVG